MERDEGDGEMDEIYKVEGWRRDGDGDGGGVTRGVEGQRVDSRVGEASRGFECLGDNREDMRQQGIFRHDVITQTAVLSPHPLPPPHFSILSPLSPPSSTDSPAWSKQGEII